MTKDYSHQVVAVRDASTGAYAAPMHVPSTQYAIRMFSQELNRETGEKSTLHTHPQDFELWLLAQWDEETGTYRNEVPPRALARATDLIITSKEKEHG